MGVSNDLFAIFVTRDKGEDRRNLILLYEQVELGTGVSIDQFLSSYLKPVSKMHQLIFINT